MPGRYSHNERLKIDYFKSKIKELRYLKHESEQVQDKLDEILFNINKSNSIVHQISTVQTNQYDQTKKWNEMIDKKDKLVHKLNILNKEIAFVETILNTLSPVTRKIAIDLYVRRFSAEKIKDKYYVSNPYQTINDELRYLEIDKF